MKAQGASEWQSSRMIAFKQIMLLSNKELELESQHPIRLSLSAHEMEVYFGNPFPDARDPAD